MGLAWLGLAPEPEPGWGTHWGRGAAVSGSTARGFGSGWSGDDVDWIEGEVFFLLVREELRARGVAATEAASRVVRREYEVWSTRCYVCTYN